MRVLKVKDALVKVKRPVKIPQSEYLPFGSYPVIDQGKSIIAGYTNDIESVIFSPLPMTIFGDHTRIVKFSKEPFASGADGTQLLYPIGDIDPTFFYYSIKNIDLSNYFYARHFKYLKESEICVPDLPVQRRIADILSAYDDLIENNQRRIALLEKTTQELYKEWFVRFRFPGYENTEFENGIPKGWKFVKLDEYANISTGKCNREDAEEDGIYPLFDRSQEIKKSSVYLVLNIR